MRGGERVLEALAELFPSADLFTLVCDRSALPPGLNRLRIRTSFLQKFPARARWYRYYLPLFPAATETFELKGYDLVISSDAAVIKGIRTDANAAHICYCHTPMRCLWSGYETRSRAAGPLAELALSAIRNRLRQWDYNAAQRVNYFVANSENVRDRIRKSYCRESVVIYPPVDTRSFFIASPATQRESYFLTVSQLVPYKRIDLIVDAFNRCKRPLVIIGDGPERRRLERQAGRNIRFEGWLPQSQVIDAMQRCKAFVFAGEEDFGIVMAEAQACGTPLIAFGRGGALEIVEDNTTGILFYELSADSLLAALDRFDRASFDSQLVRTSALRFTPQRFLDEFSAFVGNTLIQDEPCSNIQP